MTWNSSFAQSHALPSAMGSWWLCGTSAGRCACSRTQKKFPSGCRNGDFAAARAARSAGAQQEHLVSGAVEHRACQTEGRTTSRKRRAAIGGQPAPVRQPKRRTCIPPRRPIAMPRSPDKTARPLPETAEPKGQGSAATNGYWLHDTGGPSQYVPPPAERPDLAQQTVAQKMQAESGSSSRKARNRPECQVRDGEAKGAKTGPLPGKDGALPEGSPRPGQKG